MLILSRSTPRRSRTSTNTWLVTGQIVDFNPASAVRGPKHVVKKDKTPVLTAEEARHLRLNLIPP